MFQKTLDGLSRKEATHFWSYINDLKIDAGRVRNMKKNEKRLHNKINDLQVRIDKAIEHIEHNWIDYESAKSFITYDDMLDVSYLEIRQLLDILRGDE